MVDFSGLPPKRLEAMAAAGREVKEVFRVLERTGHNVVGEILRHQGTFYEWNHYPDGDVYDGKTHSQYYYHAHPSDVRFPEHGHFHTFLRPKGMPFGIRPAPVADFEPPSDPDGALSHLIAISMNRAGYPLRLFATNRWVTGEVWYAAQDVIRMLDVFDIGHAQPSWPTNRWVTAMIRLFRPQIEAILRERDESIAVHMRTHPGANVYEDRGFEVLSVREISVDDQIAAVEAVRRAGGT